MSEDLVRLLLDDAAGGDGPVTDADPATLFARARSANRRRAAGSAVAMVLVVLAGTGLAINSQRSGDHYGQGSPPPSPSPSPSPSMSEGPAIRVINPSSTASGPFCGWNDGLASAVMAGLPVRGNWGTPSKVFGICPNGIGVQITVTEAGRTGQVMAMVDRISPSQARDQICMDNRVCEQLPDGYLSSRDFTRTDPIDGHTVLWANARLATTNGVFIDAYCTSALIDGFGQPVPPPMDRAVCTGEQAKALVLELNKSEWLQ